MRRYVMKQFLVIGVVLALVILVGRARAAVTVPFDRAYTVSSAGSTTPVSSFDINGPAPVLYLDLPAAWGQYSSAGSNWFRDSVATSQFSVDSETIFASDGEYWLTPSADVWNQKKAAGNWHINASYWWWDLVIIYGGGAPVTKATGSTMVNFTVTAPALVDPGTSKVLPEPGCAGVFAMLAGVLGMGRRRRM